ncbi:hypothetical protein BGZ74_010360 [Mortierella antarctica]|nr:hypothetical protein BGZ74_010360 [Mortierella antarctica]
MVDFKYLHCNKCFRTSSTEPIEFLMTECGHVLCKPCLDLASSSSRQHHSTQPGIQSQPGDSQRGQECFCVTDFIIIKSGSSAITSLHPEAQRYFRDPQEILGEAIDAMKFQESNKEQLLDHLMDKVLRQRQVLIKVRDEMVHIKAVKRARSHVSVASSVRGGKTPRETAQGVKPTTPVPPARLSLQARPTSESPRVVLQSVVNGVAQNQLLPQPQPQPQPQYPQSNAHLMCPPNVPQMSNQMYGQQQHQHQSQHYQPPSFQSPSVINRHYQVSSAPTPAPTPQYSHRQTSQHPSYPNRISLHGSPPGIYRTPAAPGVGQPRGADDGLFSETSHAPDKTPYTLESRLD